MKNWATKDCLKVIASNWSKNHRHHGGVAAAWRCLIGTNLIRRPLNGLGGSPMTEEETVDALTFSVVPGLTSAWAVYMDRALAGCNHRVLIGDSSGGFKLLATNSTVRCFPLLNFPHGEKLDVFFQRFCRSEFVIVSDDDVFWLNNHAWRWACDQFADDDRLAVVSLRPRKGQIWPPMKERISGPPMGSYCLIIRRKIWMEEQLSFRIVESPAHKQDGYFFDTADYANVQLLDRGYHVLIAPEDVRSSVVTFDGTSCWALRIQQYQGDLGSLLAGKPDLQVKAYLSILVLRQMAALVGELTGKTEGAELVPRKSLDKAQNVLTGLLEVSARQQAEKQVTGWFAALKEARSGWPNHGGNP